MSQVRGFWVPEATQPGTLDGLGWKQTPKDRERRQMGEYWFAAERPNADFG
jgi:hypothetical protein